MTNPNICARCGTDLAPAALVCPACGTLRHAVRLKAMAADAESASARGDVETAREHWSNVLTLLPPESQQHRVVSDRIAALERPEFGNESLPTTEMERPWWRRGFAGLATLAIILASKLKFLLLGLTKASTFVSMFAFFGVYWSVFGWPLALGLVLTIYIHEMGHVAMLRRLGMAAGAPLFIPGVGAVVMLKQHVADPISDARIGLAGPIWGLGAGIGAMVVYLATAAPVWLAIAQLTGFLNLFNLIPVWQLDGSRGFHALGRTERWIVVGVVLIALLFTGQRILVLVGAAAVWRAIQRDIGPGDRQTIATFVVLILALAALARSVG